MSTIRDRIAIQDLLHRYAVLMDAGAWDRVAAEIFTEDAVCHYGNNSVVEGREQIHANFSQGGTVLQACAHMVLNPVIRVRGDKARSRAHALSWQWLHSASDKGDLRPADLLEVAGYDDELRREPQGWRISRRDVYSLGPGGHGVGAGTLPPYLNRDMPRLSNRPLSWPSWSDEFAQDDTL